MGPARSKSAGSNLARWLSRPDRPSDISGRVAFDLDLQLGRRGGFPRGPYTFEGSHAGFMNYARGKRPRARPNHRDAKRSLPRRPPSRTASNVRIDAGAIGISSPYPVPVPGQRTAGRPAKDCRPRFRSRTSTACSPSTMTSSAGSLPPYIAGGATFADSQFLGARVLTGAYGSIDTSARRFTTPAKDRSPASICSALPASSTSAGSATRATPERLPDAFTSTAGAPTRRP